MPSVDSGYEPYTISLLVTSREEEEQVLEFKRSLIAKRTPEPSKEVPDSNIFFDDINVVSISQYAPNSQGRICLRRLNGQDEESFVYPPEFFWKPTEEENFDQMLHRMIKVLIKDVPNIKYVQYSRRPLHEEEGYFVSISAI